MHYTGRKLRCASFAPVSLVVRRQKNIVANNNLIGHSFEELAQSLRILLEADWRANQGGLLMLDRAEAVGNIETALTSVLNGFHSLYDAIEKQLDTNPIDWYKLGELATILAIRNARHHNKANKIRSLYTYHAQEAENLQHMEQYVLVDYITPDDGADTFDVYVSWADLNRLLSMPKKESRINPDTCNVIKEYLNSSKYSKYATHFELPDSRVFINIVPLIVNAAATIVPLIKQHCSGNSTESAAFSSHFSSVVKADTHNHDVNCGPFVLPK